MISHRSPLASQQLTKILLCKIEETNIRHRNGAANHCVNLICCCFKPENRHMHVERTETDQDGKAGVYENKKAGTDR